MAITFTNFFGQSTHDRLNALGQDNLTQGVNLVHDGNTYNVKMLETQTEEGAHAILIFRAYTADSVLIYTKYKKDHPSKRVEEEVIGTRIQLFNMIHAGAVIDGDVATPVFAGAFSAKVNQVFEKHPELAPGWVKPADQPPGYSRNQKAFALFVSVLFLSATAYGVHKVRKGDITLPTRKEIGDFLSKTKSNTSDYLSQLRQKWMPQEGVKA
ncbi:MAG: hypothetical protein KFB95_04350 [Simkaniaceae bacterium]|nr:MAG: hypothetical protein KFB95_04350 [Simkaniaceae bacterium]